VVRRRLPHVEGFTDHPNPRTTIHRPRTISVVIPTLDEAAELPATLASVSDQSGPFEVIVADGNSADATREIAARHGATVVTSPRGRARQMNAGAANASGDVLLFLHADTQLPSDALDRVRAALADPDAAAGCFRLRFDRDGFWLWLWSRPVWMRWHRWAFGDRALFVRRSAFDAVGGFPDQPIFEDLDFVQAVRAYGRFVFLDEAVVTSARRYERGGALRQQLRNWALWTAWLLGVDPERAARFYPSAPDQRERREQAAARPRRTGDSEEVARG
jgi:rSAM/selenodomain-associated transferase 2